MLPVPQSEVRVLGRYALYDEIAAGGMATVHVGRLLGPVGFSRTVAIKRLHAQFAKDPEFVSMFLDEARLAARIRHPNVIGTLDVVALEGELFLVMEYIPGESFAKLWRASRDSGGTIPLPIVSAILGGVLDGLHAAHEATNDRGEALGIVHRDVSPHNILVGTDGIGRVLDFGVAKAAGRLQTTREGQLKGKISYMAPEQVQGTVDRTTDVYATAVVLWEAITGRRLFFAENEARTLANVLYPHVDPPSKYSSNVPAALDDVVLRALAVNPTARCATAREMARALRLAMPPAPAYDVGEWVEATAGGPIVSRASRVATIERSTPSESDFRPPPPDSSMRVTRLGFVPSANDQSTKHDRVTPASMDPPPEPPESKTGAGQRIVSIGALVVLIALVFGGAVVGFRAWQRPSPFGVPLPAATTEHGPPANLGSAAVGPVVPQLPLAATAPSTAALGRDGASPPLGASALPPPAPRSIPRFPLVAPPKRPNDTEFDHVIDSRK